MRKYILLLLFAFVGVSAFAQCDPIITGDTIICQGSTSTIDAGAGYATYLWSPGGETTQTVVMSTPGVIYSVTVTDGLGCTGTSGRLCVLGPNPAPTITGNTMFCSGSSTTLNSGAGYNSYQWSNAAITQATDISLPGMVYVTVTGGIGNCPGVDSIMITESPQIVPNVNASKEFACIGDVVQLSVSGAGPGGTYVWDNGLGAGQIHDVTVTNTVDYSVTLTDANNCTEIGNITVTAIDVPALVVNPQDTIICKGNSVNVVVTGANSYSWFPSYGLSSSVGSVVIASPDVTTNYFITGSNEMGGTVCSATIETNIEVDEFDFVLPLNQTVCKNEIVDIVASVSGGTAPYMYSWTINNIPRVEVGQAIIDTVDGDSNYRLVGVDGNGCTVTKTTTFVNYPALQFVPHINKDTVCPDDAVLFNASISGGTGAPYEFVFDGHYSNTILTVYPKETYTYQLVARDGCEEIIDSIVIATYPIPYIDFIANEYGGCVPKDIKFTPISSPAGLIDQYQWNFGDNDNNNLSISASPLHVYKNQGTYDVNMEIRTINGCFSDTTKENLIHIEPKPNLSFTPEPLTVSILKPIVYFNNQSENIDSLSFIWNFGTGDLSNIVYPEYTYNSIGNYEIELIGFTQHGCSDTIYKFIEVKPEVKFYIPTAFTPDGDNHNEIFMPAGTNITNQDYHFYIYDRWGEPIFDTDNLHEGWNGKMSGGEYAKPGIYAYYVVYKDIYGIKYEREGILNLVR